MKIGIFTNNYLPNPYGVSSSIEGFRKEFERMGHEVFVFAPDWKDHEDGSQNIFRYPAVDINIRFRYPLPIPYSSRMDKILEKLDLDIIHSQHPNLLGSAAARWAKKKNIPLVFTWHTLYDQYLNFVPFLPKKLAGRWIIGSAARYANKADQIVVPAPSVKKIIQDWGVTNSHIEAVSSGVGKFFDEADGKLVRKQYGIADDETLLLLVSRLTSEKNIEFLFDSVIEILKADKKVKFLLVGDGYLVPKLKVLGNGLEDQVIFTGIIGKDKIPDYYAASDIFVYASKSETQGMILTEAMYMGLPIVAVRATGAQDIIDDGQTGFLVSENHEEFRQAVVKLMGNKEQRMKFSSEARRIAREKYTAQACAQKMLDVYAEAIKRKKTQ